WSSDVCSSDLPACRSTVDLLETFDLALEDGGGGAAGARHGEVKGRRQGADRDAGAMPLCKGDREFERRLCREIVLRGHACENALHLVGHGVRFLACPPSAGKASA